MSTETKFKYKIAPIKDFPLDGGSCAKIGNHQIAIFQFNDGKWYACDNSCPHTGDMVISRGLTGDKNGEPKIACPMHKKNFSLIDGTCLSGDELKIKLYEVVLENDFVHIISETNLLE